MPDMFDLYFGLTTEQYQTLVQAVREADRAHEAAGGGTRHWVRDFFLPSLDAAGLQIVAK